MYFLISLFAHFSTVPPCGAASTNTISPIQYNASKAAVVQLARTLAVEWVDFCRVNSVSPGYTQTDILNFASQEMREEWLRSTPGRRFASPYEMKGVYLPLSQIYGF